MLSFWFLFQVIQDPEWNKTLQTCHNLSLPCCKMIDGDGICRDAFHSHLIQNY